MDEKNGNHWRCPLCGWNRCDIDWRCHRRRSCRTGFSDRSGKKFQDKYNWGDSEEIWDDTEQLPDELDEPDEMEEQLPEEIDELDEMEEQLDREKQCE